MIITEATTIEDILTPLDLVRAKLAVTATQASEQYGLARHGVQLVNLAQKVKVAEDLADAQLRYRRSLNNLGPSVQTLRGLHPTIALGGPVGAWANEQADFLLGYLEGARARA